MPRSPARRLPFLLLLLLLHTTSCQTPPGVEVGAGAAAPVQGELYHRVEQAVEERTIDEQDAEGRSLLLAAALQNDVASAHLLLAHRAQVSPKANNDEDTVFGTPLIAAATKGHGRIVRLLLGANADPNAKGNDPDERTPLIAAAECAPCPGSVAVSQPLLVLLVPVVLLRAASPPNPAPRPRPRYGHIDIVKDLLKAGADVHIRGDMQGCDDGTRTHPTRRPRATTTLQGTPLPPFASADPQPVAAKALASGRRR